MESFDAASRAGVDGIETDLRLSRDGEIVLFHDRFTGANEELAVDSCTRDELSSAAGYTVPTLEETLAERLDLHWILEIKCPTVLDRLVTVLAPRAVRARCIVISFHHEVISELRNRCDVECGLTTYHRPRPDADVDDAAFDLGIRHLVWGYPWIDDGLLARSAARGFSNWAYSVRSSEDHRKARSLNLAGVITDYPERFTDVKP